MQPGDANTADDQPQNRAQVLDDVHGEDQGRDQAQDRDGESGRCGDASTYEQAHVHAVYDAIADHFSATRYAPWPLVAQFLEAQPSGSIGLDVGCGNGKYLSGHTGGESSSKLFVLGSDRSAALAKLAYTKHAQRRSGSDVLLADSLALPFRDRCADFIICIAVVHHLSTRERRQAAVEELLRCVRSTTRQQQQQGLETEKHDADKSPANSSPPPAGSSSLSAGRILLYVWALEQASSRRGWAAGGEQDLLVPWVKTMKDKNKHKGNDNKARADETRSTAQPQPKSQAQQPRVPPTFHRYYHLYRQGELEEDVAAAGGRVVASGYERDNWWVVADPL